MFAVQTGRDQMSGTNSMKLAEIVGFNRPASMLALREYALALHF